MKKNKVVPLRIPEHLDALASLRAELDHTDKATALRQWLYDGAESYVMRLLGEGRITRSRAVELLGITVYDIYELAERHHVELGPTDEQLARSNMHRAELVAAIKAPRDDRAKAAS